MGSADRTQVTRLVCQGTLPLSYFHISINNTFMSHWWLQVQLLSPLLILLTSGPRCGWAPNVPFHCLFRGVMFSVCWALCITSWRLRMIPVETLGITYFLQWSWFLLLGQEMNLTGAKLNLPFPVAPASWFLHCWQRSWNMPTDVWSVTSLPQSYKGFVCTFMPAHIFRSCPHACNIGTEALHCSFPSCVGCSSHPKCSSLSISSRAWVVIFFRIYSCYRDISGLLLSIWW